MEAATTEAYVMLTLGLAVIALRIVLRVRTAGTARLCADDYLMVAAAILYIVETYLAWSIDAVWKGKANDGLTTEQREAITEGSDEFILRTGGAKTQIAVQTTFVALLWTLKSAVCCFYWRLMSGIKGYKLRILLAIVFVTASWLAVQLTLFCACTPIHKYWQIYPDPGNQCQAAISRPFLLVCLLLDITTDSFLLVVPLPMLWRSQGLSLAQKLGLTAIFSAGFMVIICAIARNTILLVVSPHFRT
ncbi:uncharacterized protein B0I36DRAFT_383466 [Microdochium trichocladiopsis]|uniref:Rhodopsin domain-containing protein n=1 Tax=Microdochium trichocladiopsis TaxID=1682393 RepID=A0A9P8YC82_9PEZI|nr:uncharacterized protein B0I36DRAFT_383466 [Microdochium trichocladiopsis]KAH7033644.1 hypothetical protein B0I36DRAFT_383466 [Microdochium trichocladiopsis]